LIFNIVLVNVEIKMINTKSVTLTKINKCFSLILVNVK